MTELYPADADLNALSGQSDPEQDVLYVPIGQSPYHTHFYKMLYRLLDVARRAGDLRVFKDGDLTFGVRAGAFQDGDIVREISESTGQALTDEATNSIYLTADGTLTVSTTGLPDPSTTPHIPLAEIAVTGGTYDHADITDLRGRALLAVQAGLSPAVAAVLTGRAIGASISAGAESGDTRRVTVQLTDAAGANLASRAAMRVWISASEFGSPSSTGHTVAVATGTSLTTVLSNADYRLLTDAAGVIELDITAAGAPSRYVMVEVGGHVVSSGELTWSA